MLVYLNSLMGDNDNNAQYMHNSLFKEFNCSTKLLFVESVAIEFDSANKFVGFITSKRSVEALHFSVQIDDAINILLLCVVQNVSE